MPHIYLAQWKWFSDPEQGSWWEAPAPGGLLVQDLRSFGQAAQRDGIPQGRGIWVYRTQQTIPGAYYLGADPQRHISLLDRSAIETALGKRVVESRVDRVLMELFIRHADPTGENAWKPARISRLKGWRLVLGHFGQVLQESYNYDHPAFQATLAVRWADYRRNRALVEQGLMTLSALRRWNGSDMLRYFGRAGDDLLPALVPPEHQRDGWDWPATTIAESFNQADSTTLGPDLGWSEFVNGSAGDAFETVSNKAENLGGGGVADARADSDLSSDAHYAQGECESVVGGTSFIGVDTRFSASAHTAYIGRYRNTTTATYRIEKVVAGTVSNLGNLNESPAPGAGPLTLKLESDSNDDHELFVGGVSKVTVPGNSDITGNLRAGIHAEAGNNRTRVDVWEAADLAAGAAARRRMMIF